MPTLRPNGSVPCHCIAKLTVSEHVEAALLETPHIEKLPENQ
jgi:hypothetical protein